MAPPPQEMQVRYLNRQDVNKLFGLLEQLYQGRKKSRDEVTVAIWAEVLKPWSYEQVRDAVIHRARENRYMPDPSELADYLPKPAADRREVDRYAPPTPSELRSLEKMRQWQREWHEELHRRGLPTMIEAENQGIKFSQWAAMVEDVDAPEW